MIRFATRSWIVLLSLGALACGQPAEDSPAPAPPDRDGARVRMARTLLEQGHVDAALEQLHKLGAGPLREITPQAQPEWFEPVLRQLVLRRALAPADSMLALTGPVSQRPPWMQSLSANLMVLQGDTEGAIATWSSIRSQDPQQQVQIHHELGTLYLLTQRAQEAAVQARAGLTLDPQAWRLRIMLAEALYAQGQHEAALEEVRKLEPDVPRWQVEARIEQYGMDRPERALLLLVQANRTAPRNPDVRLQLARAYLATDQPLQARALLQQLVNLPVPFTGSREALVQALEASGEQAAAASLRAQLRHEAQQAEARALRVAGLQSSMAGDLEAALASFDQALALTDGDADLHNDRGAVLARLERYAEAERSFLRAQELAPEDPFVQQNLARLYQRTGDETRRDAAIARWQELTGGDAPQPE